MLALSRQVAEQLGQEDDSPIVYEYGDGWTIRRVTGLWNQHREGVLLRNCLPYQRREDVNCWSLRDRDNLPHLCFALWRVDPDDDLSEVPEEVAKSVFVRGTHLLINVDAPHGLKDKRRAQLLEFASADVDLDDVRWFPDSTIERARVIAQGHNVAFFVPR